MSEPAQGMMSSDVDSSPDMPLCVYLNHGPALSKLPLITKPELKHFMYRKQSIYRRFFVRIAKLPLFAQIIYQYGNRKLFKQFADQQG